MAPSLGASARQTRAFARAGPRNSDLAHDAGRPIAISLHSSHTAKVRGKITPLGGSFPRRRLARCERSMAELPFNPHFSPMPGRLSRTRSSIGRRKNCSSYFFSATESLTSHDGRPTCGRKENGARFRRRRSHRKTAARNQNITCARSNRRPLWPLTPS